MIKKIIYFLPVFLTCFLLNQTPPHAEDTPQNNDHQGEAHSNGDEAPEVDSVWGALKYTGYHIKKGSITAGKGIKTGGEKAGEGIKTGGKAMGKGFKKAGSSIKTFFVGDDD